MAGRRRPRFKKQLREFIIPNRFADLANPLIAQEVNEARIIRETGWTFPELRAAPAERMDRMLIIWEEDDRHAANQVKK